MKKTITIITLLILTSSAFSQNLNFELLEKLTKISIISIDDYMIEGYGFKKIEIKEDDRKRKYARYYDNDYDNTIVITILLPKTKLNVLNISVAKNYNIRKIKDELLSRGYEYEGTNEMGLLIFKKENSVFLFSKEPNKSGATQIMVISD